MHDGQGVTEDAMKDDGLDWSSAIDTLFMGHPPGRRLSDKILLAFDHACEAGDIDAARELLTTLSGVVTRTPTLSREEQRVASENLIDANFRLWDLTFGPP
jgi:hypothetical protein